MSLVCKYVEENLLLKIYSCGELAILREHKVDNETAIEWFEEEKDYERLLSKGLITVIGYRGFPIEREEDIIGGKKLFVRVTEKGAELARVIISLKISKLKIDEEIIQMFKSLRNNFGYIPFTDEVKRIAKYLFDLGIVFKAMKFDDHGRYVGDMVCVAEELLVSSDYSSL